MLGFSTRDQRHKRRRIISTAVHHGAPGGAEGAAPGRDWPSGGGGGGGGIGGVGGRPNGGHRGPLSSDQMASIRINKALTNNGHLPQVRGSVAHHLLAPAPAD